MSMLYISMHPPLHVRCYPMHFVCAPCFLVCARLMICMCAHILEGTVIVSVTVKGWSQICILFSLWTSSAETTKRKFLYRR